MGSQVGGTHYGDTNISPFQVIDDWGLDFYRASALKYIKRAGRKEGAKRSEDLRKAEHYLREAAERAEQAERSEAQGHGVFVRHNLDVGEVVIHVTEDVPLDITDYINSVDWVTLDEAKLPGTRGSLLVFSDWHFGDDPRPVIVTAYEVYTDIKPSQSECVSVRYPSGFNTLFSKRAYERVKQAQETSKAERRNAKPPVTFYGLSRYYSLDPHAGAGHVRKISRFTRRVNPNGIRHPLNRPGDLITMVDSRGTEYVYSREQMDDMSRPATAKEIANYLDEERSHGR